MELIETAKELLNRGDPVIRSWPLVNSYWHPLMLSALYVFFVKRLGPALMHNKKPFDLRNLMIVYNFAIVSVYGSSLLTMLYKFLTTDAYKWICVPTYVPSTTHYIYTFTALGWYLYLLKYIEFLDTVFFILRKKDHLITNLHVIHHAILPVLAWTLMRSETTGFQFIPGVINSCIHTIMYTYYGLAAMGPAMQKRLWWKKHLTRLQMLQFIIILFFMFVVVPVSGCKTTTYGIYLNIVFASLFLGLFYNFYKKTYESPAKRSAYSATNGTNGATTHANGEATHTDGATKHINGETTLINGGIRANGSVICANGIHKYKGARPKEN